MRRSICIALSLLLCGTALADEKENAKIMGRKASVQAKDFIKNNLSNFGKALSSGGELSTIKGKKFSVNLNKPSSPSGQIKLYLSGGDLYASITGKLSPTHISGICENGYISCSPGTWNNCKYFIYDNGAFREADAYQELISCFCISQGACNFRWSKNWLKWVLDKFTYMLNYTNASFTDVITENSATRDFTAVETVKVSESDLRDKDKAIQEIESNDMVKAYEANPYTSKSNQRECKIANFLNGSGQTIKTKLVFLNGKELKGTVCIGMEQDNGSVYKCYLPNNLSVSCGTGWAHYVCGKFGVKWSVADDVGEQLIVGGNTIVYRKIHGGGNEGQSGTLTCDLESGNCNCSVSGAGAFSCSSFNVQQPGGCAQVSFSVWNNGACNGAGTGSFWVYVKEVPDVSVIHYNTCRSISKKCKLKDEWVCFYPPSSNYSNAGVNENYCVQTVTNYHRHSFTKFVCYEFKSSNLGLNWKVCMNGQDILAISPDGQSYKLRKFSYPEGWTYVRRVYVCPEEEGLNIDKAINRANYIKEHSTFNSKKVAYSGQMGCSQVNDKWVCYANNKVYNSQSACEAECSYQTDVDVGESPWPLCKVGNSEGVYVCKVAIVGNEVRAVSNDNGTDTAPNRIDIGSQNYEYRPCEARVDDSGRVSYYCPVSEGEQILEDCKCDTSDEAMKAITTVETLDQMSHDIICSSSPP